MKIWSMAAAMLFCLAGPAAADIIIDSGGLPSGASVAGTTLTVTGLVASTATISNLQLPNITAGSVVFSGGSGVATGSGVLTNGQLLIGDGTGAPAVATLTQGDADRVTIANAAGTITLSGPQDINTTSTPQFLRLGIGQASAATYGLNLLHSASVNGVNAWAIWGKLVTTVAGTGEPIGNYNEVQCVADGTYANGCFAIYNSIITNGGESIGTAGVPSKGVWMTRDDLSLVTGTTATIAGGYYFKDTSSMTHGDRYGVYIDTPTNALNTWVAGRFNGLDNGKAMRVNIAATSLDVTTADTFIQFEASTATVGSIAGSAVAGTIAYNVTSDRRLKENILDANPAGAIIDAIRVRSFDYRASGAHQRYGVIAQELEPVFPEAVSVGGEDYGRAPWQVDYQKLIPLLVKEIQTLRSRVNDLERRGR